MARPIVIAPSLLSADFGNVADEIGAMESAGADWLHLDVMDGHFVPNISFGVPVIAAARRLTQAHLDVHLMIAPADPYLEAFAKAGADTITVHAEAGPHLDRSLQAITSLGKRAGVALNPATPVSAIGHVLDRIDLVLVMTVNPGFGGQAFIPAMLEKISAVRTLIEGRDIDLEVDGGVTAENAESVAEKGANVFVAGSAAFQGGATAYRKNLAAIRSSAERGRHSH